MNTPRFALLIWPSLFSIFKSFDFLCVTKYGLAEAGRVLLHFILGNVLFSSSSLEIFETLVSNSFCLICFLGTLLLGKLCQLKKTCSDLLSGIKMPCFLLGRLPEFL